MESSQLEFSLEAKRITTEDFEFVAGKASLTDESHANYIAADEQSPNLRRGAISEESINDKIMVQRQGAKVTAKTNENLSNKSSCETGEEDEDEKEDRVMKELRKVQRQILVTQCLVSALMVLTLTWQVSEVSLILKLKDGLNHPLRSFGGFVSWMLRRRLKAPHQGGGGGDEEEKEEERKQKKQGEEASPFPSITIPNLSFSSLDFITED